MPAFKAERVAEQIQHIVSELLERRIKDPRLSMINVTAVKISPTLREATVFVSALGGSESRHDVMEGLDSAKGFLRREVGHRLQLRNVPELAFKWDEGMERGDHVLNLLDDLKE